MVLMYFGYSYLLILFWKSSAGMYGYRYLLNTLPITIYLTIIFLGSIKDSKIKNMINILIVILSINSFTSQILANTTEALSPKNTVNVFGIKRDGVYSSYNKILFHELATKNLYKNIIEKSTGGLLIATIFNKVGYYRFFDDNSYNNFKKYFPNNNLLMLLKVMIVYCFWVILGLKLLQKPNI